MISLVLRLLLATVVSSALYVTALSFPSLATPLLLLVPLPGLVLAARWGTAETSLWLVLVMLTIAVVLGMEAVPGFALPLGGPAMAMAVAMRQSWSFERTALAGIATWTLGAACLSLLTYGDVTTLVAAAREQVEHGFDVVLSTSESLGNTANAGIVTEAERAVLVDRLLGILPALMVLTGALTVLGNLVLLRGAVDVSPDVNLRMWRTPDVLIWALILTGFGMFAPLPWVALVARNFFVVLLGCYFCQGLAIVAYYLDRFKLPHAIRVAGYMLIAVQYVVTAMVLALGVFDLWGNFRRSSAGPADLGLDADGE